MKSRLLDHGLQQLPHRLLPPEDRGLQCDQALLGAPNLHRRGKHKFRGVVSGCA